MPSFIQKFQAIQYDGTNSTAMLGLFPAFTDENGRLQESAIISESGGVLTIGYPRYYTLPYVMNVGDWYGPQLGVLTNDQLLAGWTSLSDMVNP